MSVTRSWYYLNMYCYDPVTESVSPITGAVEEARNGFEEDVAFWSNIPYSYLDGTTRIWYMFVSYYAGPATAYTPYQMSMTHTSSSGQFSVSNYNLYTLNGDQKFYRFRSTNGVAWTKDGEGFYWKGEGTEVKAPFIGSGSVQFYAVPAVILPDKILSGTTSEITG